MAISCLYQTDLYEAKNGDMMKKQMINLEKMCKDSINMCRRVFLVREEAWKFWKFLRAEKKLVGLEDLGWMLNTVDGEDIDDC